MAGVDPYLGLLQGLNSAVGAYQDRSSQLEALGARADERKAAQTLDEQKEKDRRKFEMEKLDKEYKLKKELETTKSDTRAKRKGSTGGKILPAGEASSLGLADSSIKTLNDYAGSVDTSNSNVVGPGLLKSANRFFQGTKGYLGFEPSQEGKDLGILDAKRTQAAQVIGTYLEGGKLTDADFPKYINMLPDAADAPEVRQAKRENLAKLIADRQKAQQLSLGQAGYDVQEIGSQPQGLIKNNTAQAAPQAQQHPEDQQAIQWAMSNPRDPRAQKILQLHNKNAGN